MRQQETETRERQPSESKHDGGVGSLGFGCCSDDCSRGGYMGLEGQEHIVLPRRFVDSGLGVRRSAPIMEGKR